MIGMIGEMGISFNVGLRTTGGAMVGLCCQKINQVDLSDIRDCFNCRVHLGLVRSSISISEGSFNMYLMIDGGKMEIHG